MAIGKWDVSEASRCFCEQICHTSSSPRINMYKLIFQRSLWRCIFAVRKAHDREELTSAYLQKVAQHGLRRHKSHLRQTTDPPYSLPPLTWTSLCTSTLLAGLSANKWLKAPVPQIMLMARLQPMGPSLDDPSDSAYKGDPAWLLKRKSPQAGSISPKLRCPQSAAEQLGRGPFYWKAGTCRGYVISPP